MNGSRDGRRTALLATAVVVVALVLAVVAVVGESSWAAVGVLVLLTPLVIALALRWIARL